MVDEPAATQQGTPAAGLGRRRFLQATGAAAIWSIPAVSFVSASPAHAAVSTDLQAELVHGQYRGGGNSDGTNQEFGGTVFYGIRLSNTGSQPLNNIVVTIRVPATTPHAVAPEFVSPKRVSSGSTTNTAGHSLSLSGSPINSNPSDPTTGDWSQAFVYSHPLPPGGVWRSNIALNEDKGAIVFQDAMLSSGPDALDVAVDKSQARVNDSVAGPIAKHPWLATTGYPFILYVTANADGVPPDVDAWPVERPTDRATKFRRLSWSVRRDRDLGQAVGGNRRYVRAQEISSSSNRTMGQITAVVTQTKNADGRWSVEPEVLALHTDWQHVSTTDDGSVWTSLFTTKRVGFAPYVNGEPSNPADGPEYVAPWPPTTAGWDPGNSQFAVAFRPGATAVESGSPGEDTFTGSIQFEADVAGQLEQSAVYSGTAS